MEGVTIEVKFTTSAFGPDPDKPGETKVLFKRKKKRALIELDDISVVSQYHNDRGKLVKSKCEIVHRSLGNLVLDMPFLELVKAKEEKRIVVKGYKQYKQKNGKR